MKISLSRRAARKKFAAASARCTRKLVKGCRPCYLGVRVCPAITATDYECLGGGGGGEGKEEKKIQPSEDDAFAKVWRSLARQLIWVSCRSRRPFLSRARSGNRRAVYIVVYRYICDVYVYI